MAHDSRRAIEKNFGTHHRVMSYVAVYCTIATTFRAPRNICLKPGSRYMFVTQPAAIKLRRESGASCSSSYFVALEIRQTACPRHVMPLGALSIVQGPQPDTEEEGSALDFPEVKHLFKVPKEWISFQLSFRANDRST